MKPFKKFESNFLSPRYFSVEISVNGLPHTLKLRVCLVA